MIKKSLIVIISLSFLLIAVAGIMISQVNADPSIHQGQIMFKSTTYESLKAYEPQDRIVAIVKCKSVVVSQRGSRSERQTMETIVVAGPDSMPPGSALILSTFAQGADLMKAGETYLVAAYVESPADPLAIVEIVPTHDVAADWAAVQGELQKQMIP